jgi:predicted glycoside hydrolase/deacetylase ChbG (UPF0249 family)
MRLQSAQWIRALLLAELLVASSALAQPYVSVQERLGYPRDAHLLILHADDLGMAHSVDRASFEALEKGWVSSASILVPCPWLPEVLQFAKKHPEADLGIHLALNSEWTPFRWGPVSPRSDVPSLLDEEGYLPLVEEAVVDKARPAEVERELRAQILRAQALGLPPTHLDSHMGTLDRTSPLFAIYRGLGKEFGLPIRMASEAPHPFETGAGAGEALIRRVVQLEHGVAAKDWFAAYKKLLEPLPPGVYEMIVHLAYDDEEMRGATFGHPDWGAGWRQSDFDLVRSPEFHDLLHRLGFTLVKWRDLGRALPSDYVQRP